MESYPRLKNFALMGLAVCTLSFIADPVHAAAPKLEISMPGDEIMDCPAIAQEVSKMDDVILQSYIVQQSSEKTTLGVGVAKTVGSFLVGSLTGALGILAAGHFASEAADDKGEVAAALEDIARQRRSLMVGMHNAKECKEELPVAPPPMEDLWPKVVPASAGTEPAIEHIEPASGREPARPLMAHEMRDYNG
jgi:hypothetical protein